MGVVRKLPPIPKTADTQTRAWFSAANEIILRLSQQVAGNSSASIGRVVIGSSSSSGGDTELVINKSINLLLPDNVKYPTTLAVFNAIQAATENGSNEVIIDDWDVSLEDSVALGAESGDFYHITGAGVDSGVTLKVDDYVLFYTDELGALKILVIVNGDLKEDKSNKATDLTSDDDVHYPTTKAVKTALDEKEDTILSGAAYEYWRGDKTWQTLNKAAVGLPSVDNTSDADKPVSTAQATAIGAKENTSNKAVDFSTVDDTKYPSVQAVVNLVDLRVPEPPSTGTFTLQSVDGVVSWV